MPVTKTGNEICTICKTAASFMGTVVNDGLTHPLSMGFNAMSIASGDMSAGEAFGASIGGAAGWEGAKRMLPKATRYLPGFAKATRFLPGWMKVIGGFAATAAGGLAGGSMGQRIGKAIPIWKRQPKYNTFDGINFNN